MSQGNADEGYYDWHIPFTFPFYGGKKSLLKVSTNGYVSFSGEQPPDSISQQVPTAGAPNDLIAAYWTDLDASADGAIVLSATDSLAVITWEGVAYHVDSTWGNPDQLHCSFQLLLNSSGGITMQYKELHEEAVRRRGEASAHPDWVSTVAS